MAHLSLPELKRLKPPFASKADQAKAEHRWTRSPVPERAQADEQLLSEFCRRRGVDIDKPTDKTIRRMTWEEKNRQYEEWHSAYEPFHASR